MGNFNLSKLSSLSSALTPKEEAKIVIGYFVKQDSGEGHFENEIQTIVDAVSQYNISEYQFYWYMYMNTQQILLDYQATYLRLQIQIGRLVFLRYLMEISPLLVYANRSGNDDTTFSQKMLELLQIMTVKSNKEVDEVKFSTEELGNTSTELMTTIRRLLQALINYKNLFCRIEEKVFDGMEIIARKGLWQDVDEYIEEVITENNIAIKKFINSYEALAYPSKASFKNLPNLMLEEPRTIDEKWVDELFRGLIGYAERDSHFRWR